MSKQKPPADFDDDAPEVTDADLARAKFFKDVFPEQLESWERNRGGRPKAKQPKVLIGFRLAQDVVSHVRGSGPGYNLRVEQVLRDAIKSGRL